MKELKNPIALLVLILVVASFSAPFGTPEFAVFAKDYLPAVATLVAAYAGVWFAADLNQKTATKELRLRQAGVGTRALFTMGRQLNTIALYQESVVDKFRNYPPAPLAMPPLLVPLDDSAKVDIDSLAFLLEHGHSDLLVNLGVTEMRYVHAIDAIRRRSALHADEVQPKIEDKMPNGRNLTPDELRAIIGVRLFNLLVDQTREVIDRTDDAVATIEAVEIDLHTALKKIFPEGKFPRSAPVDPTAPARPKPPRPTGLL